MEQNSLLARAQCFADIALFSTPTGKMMVLVTLINITPDEGSAVHGALYICEKGSMCKMDHEHIHEGNRFHLVIVKVEKRNGEVVDAIAYKANKEYVKGGLKPSEIYLNEILEGEDLLPKEYTAYLRSLKG